MGGSHVFCWLCTLFYAYLRICRALTIQAVQLKSGKLVEQSWDG